MSKVLVVTPAYCDQTNNRDKLLVQTIYWMQQQSYQDYLHLVIDDGSIQETHELLDGLSEHVPRLKVLHRARGGPSQAINWGIERIRGEYDADYVTVVHSDDVLPPRSLESRVTAATRKNTPVVHGNSVVFHDSEQFMPKYWKGKPARPDELFASLLRYERIAYHTLMWETDFLVDKVGGFDPCLFSCEDHDIALETPRQLVLNGLEACYIDESVYCYRLHGSNQREENVRKGETWKAYMHILSKHYSGMELLKSRADLASWWLKTGEPIWRWFPEPLRKPLRKLRRSLSETQSIGKEESNFIDKIKKCDYEQNLSKLYAST